MKKDNISRRDFIKRAGLGAIASSTILSACTNKETNSSNNILAQTEIPTDKMTYRTDNKGNKVSLLGYGCMRWPMKKSPEDVKKEIIDQETVNELVDYALAHGVNLFDTAPPYCRGLSEEATGIALSRHPRDSYFISTKLSNQRFAGQGLSAKEMYDKSIEMYKKSLTDLRTDYIDYYLLHILGMGDGMNTLNERIFEPKLIDYFLKEREAGRIRNLGFSYHGDVKVFDYMLSRHDEFKWDFVLIQLNYVDYRHASGINFNAEYLYNELEKRNIPVLVMEPLLGGRLASLPAFLAERLKRRRPTESIASWAFRFAGTNKRILSVLSGMTYMEHLQDNIRTFSPLDPCSTEELALLEDTAETLSKFPSVPCTTCQYCMPCPYGINIPAIFSHYNKCINDGNAPKSSRDENYAEARRAYLIGYDRKVEKLRQANHCVGCGVCKPHCPQSINIPKELQRIDKYVEQLKQETL